MVKSYHHGELRTALIAAGMTVLETTGSTDISLREIARSAGVSPTATYRHFASKEALLAAIAGQGFADLEQRFTASQGNLTAFGRVYVSFARERPAMFRLMFAGSYSIDSLSDGAQKVGHGAYASLLAGVAKLANLPPDDPKVLSRAVRLWSLVHGYAMLLLDNRLPDAAQTDAFLAQMLDGSRGQER